MDVLNEKRIKYFTFDDWKIIDEYEKTEGKKRGKPREKIMDKETFEITIKNLKNILNL